MKKLALFLALAMMLTTFPLVDAGAFAYAAGTATINSQEGLTAEAEGQDAGSYPVSIEGTPVVRDADGNDVTAQFALDLIGGTLNIGQRQVTLTSADAEKEYNLEVRENARIPNEEIKLEFSDGGLTATITDLHGNYDDDITTWQVGRII